jgi:hypothetical protein
MKSGMRCYKLRILVPAELVSSEVITAEVETGQ